MPKYADMRERILAGSVAADTFYAGEPCWLWVRKRRVNRAAQWYGALTVRVRGKIKNVQAHRASIAAFTGRSVPGSRVVKHLCNNTLCVNPAHLSGGTQSSNMKQCVREGRHNSQQREARA